MSTPILSRRRWAVPAALVAASALLASCAPLPVPPPPSPAPPPPTPVRRPTPPIDIADLRGAPPATDLAGRFAYGAADGHIWTVDAATGRRVQITHGRGGPDFDPHWSPDGSRLVFRTERVRPPDPTGTGYNGILVIDADGTAEHAVNPPGGGLFPEWSPTGRIVFSSPRPNGAEGLFSVRSDGTGLRDLRLYAEHVTWSSDGTSTLLDRNDGSRGQQDWNIWRATGTFAGLHRLTSAAGDDHFAGWSPDATRIAFSTTRTDEGDVWLMGRDGTGQAPLLTGPGPQSAEAWLPDGRILIADYSRTEPAWYLLRADGSSPRTVTQLAGQQGPVDYTPQ